MHDFDYDAMQKKRIARGAMHMKRGSKSTKCNLRQDNMTAAQLRRLNGPVSTYKMDEPMTKESFKAMPEDLQKQYIRGLQEMYQATDGMLGEMFGASSVTVLGWRRKLGIDALPNSRVSPYEHTIRHAKWEAFCNGVVGGKPGEPGEPKTVEVPVAEAAVEEANETFLDEKLAEFDEPVLFEDFDIQDHSDPETVHAGTLIPVYTPVPSRLDVTYIEDIDDMDDLKRIVQTLHIPTGKCKIRISIEAL